MRYRHEPPEGPPGAARSAGLRRLSRLTWRATQLSAVTAVGFATLFARTAPAQTTDQATTAASTEPASSAGTLAPSASQRHHLVDRKSAPGVQPTAQPGQAASPSGSRSRSPGPSSSSSSSSSSGSPGGSRSSSPSLAPPSSAPAPAPSASSTPAPKPTVSSPSHSGG